jgi:hypothetical protein
MFQDLLVGQDGILQPIGNRPFFGLQSLAKRPINNRAQDSILPHKGMQFSQTRLELTRLEQAKQG